MTVGKNIRMARDRADMTQKELAQKIGKGFSTIQKYELDLVSPPIEVIQKIAEALMVPISDLVNADGTAGAAGTVKTIIDLVEVEGTTPQNLLSELSLPASLFEDWRSGKSSPDDETLKIIAERLHTSLPFLLGESHHAVPLSQTSDGKKILDDILSHEKADDLIIALKQYLLAAYGAERYVSVYQGQSGPDITVPHELAAAFKELYSKRISTILFEILDSVHAERAKEQKGINFEGTQKWPIP